MDRIRVAACCLMAAVALAPARAQDAAEVARQLDEVREAIAALVADQRRTRAEEDTALAALRQADEAVARISREIAASDAAIARLDAEQGEIEQRIGEHRRSLAGQREALEAQLRSAYAFGTQPRTKLLLDLDDPGQAERVLAYYGYYNRARQALITGILEELDALDELQARAARLRGQATEARTAQAARRDERTRARGARQRLVQQLRHEIDRQQHALDTLGQDQQRLSALLRQLEDLLSDIPADPAGIAFAGLKGRLEWPVQGRLGAASGPGRPAGMRAEAALIEAEAGAPVRAVAHGRVAYSDWLRGFGLLAIIDHGEGYMTLYGFNETLLVEVGDWVAPGQVIARVGRSGARESDTLYFEIRRDGEPVDARDWFARAAPGE